MSFAPFYFPISMFLSATVKAGVFHTYVITCLSSSSPMMRTIVTFRRLHFEVYVAYGRSIATVTLFYGFRIADWMSTAFRDTGRQ